MNIPTRILKELIFISSFLEKENDWKVIKKLLLKYLPSHQRSLFKKKDGNLNEFERIVIKEYEKISNISLYIDGDKE